MFARNALATVAVAGLLAVGSAVASAAIAAADPAPVLPVDPAVTDPAAPPGPTVPGFGAPLGPNGLSLLSQAGQPAAPGQLGAPEGLDLNPNSLLGQTPLPGGPPPPPLNLRAFNNGYLLPQNEVPSAPGQGEVVGVAPGEENANVSGVEWIGQIRDLYRNGNLKGGLLGRVPKEQLGEPLPGTAPPPGTNLPPGLEEYLPDPAAGAPPVVPPAG